MKLSTMLPSVEFLMLLLYYLVLQTTGKGAPKKAAPKKAPPLKPVYDRIKESNSATQNANFLQRMKEFKFDNAPKLEDIVSKCAPNKAKPVVKNFLAFPYIHTEPDYCKGDMFLLTIVHSTIGNLQRRSVIRRTWGSLRFVGNYRVAVLFFISSNGNKDTQSKVDEESRQYRDIVQRDFIDHYGNMTLKHLTAYEFVSTHCSHVKYIMKVDDDTFVDVYHAVAFLTASPPDGFYCSSTGGALPRRKGKWAVTYKEYKEKRYPPYCEGYGYLIQTSHVTNLYMCSMFKDYLWIDDVYVCGILPRALGIPVNRFMNGHGYDRMLPSFASERILDVIFLTAYYNEFIDSIWRKLWRAVLTYSMDTV